MKIFLSIFSLLCCFSFSQTQNTKIKLNSDLNLNCKFEKVILKNPDHNFESFTKVQINPDHMLVGAAVLDNYLSKFCYQNSISGYC